MGRGDSRSTAEALRGGLERRRHGDLRPQWLECKEPGLEGLRMRLKGQVGNKSLAMTLMGFKQGSAPIRFAVGNDRAGC